MDQVHLHLLLNHLPVVGVIMGVLVFGFFTKQPWVKRSALFVILLSALFAVPAYLTGEGAEDSLERVAGFDEAFIGPHEDVATLYVWIIGGLEGWPLYHYCAGF